MKLSSNNQYIRTGNLWENDYIESFKRRRHQALICLPINEELLQKT